jgi:hypothetical protein
VLEPSAFSLRETLGTGVTTVRDRAASHQIALSLDMAADLDAIMATSGRSSRSCSTSSRTP